MRTATIIGSTGLIGNQIVKILENDKEFSTIYSISRAKQKEGNERFIHIPFETGNYNFPQNSDIAFCCLGTTMKKAGSKEQFLKVDLEMVVNFAKKAKESGVTRLAVVSSIGANPKSGNFYLRTKGQMEEELKKMEFERLVIVRPSLLLGKRNEKRLGEDIGRVLYSALKFLFIGPLKKYRGIDAEEVAKAMIAMVSKGQGTVIAESNVLAMFSNEYKS